MLVLAAGPGCISAKPCDSGGDVAWEPPIKGERRCSQKRHPKTRLWVNHGKFIQYDLEGHKIVEGTFKLGEKDGIWVQYSPEGKKLKEKYFEDGVEKGLAAPENRSDDDGPQRPPQSKYIKGSKD